MVGDFLRLLIITGRLQGPCYKGFLLYRDHPWLPVITNRWLRGGSVVPETMANSQITKRLIDSLKPRASEYFVWDRSLAGYGVRVHALLE
jgi:hypothetical protein